MTERSDVLIVGGGIAGLAAAHRLEQTMPQARVVLLESQGHLGGRIHTIRDSGFTVEAGPDSFLSSKPAGIRLAGEVGLAEQLEGVDEATRATFIVRDGALHPLPEGLSGLVPGRLGPLFRSDLLSPRARVRVALEQTVRARRGRSDEALGSFMRRRFGAEAYERMIEPLMSGIYGGNGDALSLLATFPQLRKLEIEHGSVLRGIKRSSATPSGTRRAGSPFVAPVEGMEALPRAIHDRLSSVSVHTGTPVRSISRLEDGYRISAEPNREFMARSVIITTPAYVTAALVSALDYELAGLHRGISYGSTATVSLGYSPDTVAPGGLGHGYIIPRREGRPLMAVTFSSRKFRHRGPRGALLIRGFVRVGNDQTILSRSDGDLEGMLRDELRKTHGIGAEPERAWVFRLPNSMPHYAVGHLDRLAAIDVRIAQHPGIFVAGATYHGVGIPDCIASGEAAAHQAGHWLGYT